MESTRPQPSPSTPPRSRSSSSQSSRASSSKRRRSGLSLDLSDVPSLVEPAPPSNTLLVTNLQDPSIFAPTTLAHLQRLISESSPHGLHSFSPLPSFRRIVLLFHEVDSAIAIRTLLDGETLFGSRVRVYFAAPTPLENLETKLLQAPPSQKQFFISPPPSPPAGWQMRNEDPPNKQIHAGDLASALHRLEWRADAGNGNAPLTQSPSVRKPQAADDAEDAEEEPRGRKRQHTGSSAASFERMRLRSGSTTMVYVPSEHGNSPDLPAIAVEDTTESPAQVSPVDLPEGGGRKLGAHTARPPVETMHEA